MKATSFQIQKLHSLLPEAVKNDQHQKAMLVTQYTNSPVLKSTKDLSFEQANELIVRYGGKALHYDNWAFFDFKNTQHRYMLSLLIQLGWSYYSAKQQKTISDLYRFSEWLKSEKSPVQKPLKEMNQTECSKILGALESMLSKTLK
jgi:hypothetical protein